MDPEQVLSADDISELFGISVATVDNWVFKGQVRSTLVRTGRAETASAG
ncbi:MAG: hypothetical protein ACR2LK_09475 [Solirubrobacteraceae bacterium]